MPRREPNYLKGRSPVECLLECIARCREASRPKRPWERKDLSLHDRQQAVGDYYRDRARGEVESQLPNPTPESVVLDQFEPVAKQFIEGCESLVRGAGGDPEALLRRAPMFGSDEALIDESLDKFHNSIRDLFKNRGVTVPKEIFRGDFGSTYNLWKKNLRQDAVPDVWTEWGFMPPDDKPGRKKKLAELQTACSYAAWVASLESQVRMALEVTWEPWAGPLDMGRVTSPLASALSLLSAIDPEHVFKGIGSIQQRRDAASGSPRYKRAAISLLKTILRENQKPDSRLSNQEIWQLAGSPRYKSTELGGFHFHFSKEHEGLMILQDENALRIQPFNSTFRTWCRQARQELGDESSQ